jgi:diguanylate cyclase (GGDEF)-like protein/PAS domain S-box-containing protein
MTRPDQPIMFTNESFDRLAGFPSAELVGRNCRLLQGPDTNQAAVDRIRAAVAAGVECRELLVNYRGPERHPWWNEVHLSPMKDGAGRVVQYIGIQNDVSARVRAERDLEVERGRGAAGAARMDRLDHTDPLTGLMSRSRFEDQLEGALLTARMYERAVTLLFLDIDGFRSVNDSHGHAAGDLFLRTTAQRLRGRLRASDLLARLGGDEFLVALTGLDPVHAAREAQVVADQLASAVARTVPLPAGDVRLTVSIAISTSPHDADDFGHLFRLADQRMCELKLLSLRPR